MNPLDRAIRIAVAAHEGQTDKTGGPYFEHCERVASLISDEDGKIVAYLHDVVEKGAGWSIERLRREGFSSPVLMAVDALTRRPGRAGDRLYKPAGHQSSGCFSQANRSCG